MYKHIYIYIITACFLSSCSTKILQHQEIDTNISKEENDSSINVSKIQEDVKNIPSDTNKVDIPSKIEEDKTTQQGNAPDYINNPALINYKYVLKSIPSYQKDNLVTQYSPYIVINDAGEVYGFSGCNRIIGRINLDNIASGVIKFNGLGVTRMMCALNAVELENTFLSIMPKVSYYKLENNQLILQNAKYEDVLLFDQLEKQE